MLQAEKVSFMSILDSLVIVISLSIWALAPGDFAAIIMHYLYNKLSQVTGGNSKYRKKTSDFGHNIIDVFFLRLMV